MILIECDAGLLISDKFKKNENASWPRLAASKSVKSIYIYMDTRQQKIIQCKQQARVVLYCLLHESAAVSITSMTF